MIRLVVTALVLTLFAAARPAAAQTESAPTAAEPGSDAVRAMLSGYESVPTLAEWRRLGPAVLPVLIRLYEARETAPYVRLRAIAATAAFPTELTRTFLRTVAQTATSDLIAREAVLTLGRAFADGIAEDVAPFLQHDAPVVREAAARTLGRVGTPGCRALLEARLPSEAHPVVRTALVRALARAT
ncbi:MAG: HEAT repeat domain-containing protein [Myxococcota bacterium]